ncbi:fungal specific transcription factor domain-containing protein [Paraphaeosphaeria sporulosa]
MSDKHAYSANAADHVQKTDGSLHGRSAAPYSRSCFTCRRRKVKCDIKQPCSNCARAKIECTFPGPGRAPRKSVRPPDAELLERLRRLEGIVQSLSAQAGVHEQEAVKRERDNDSRQRNISEHCFGSAISDDSAKANLSVVVDNSAEGLKSRSGRLVVAKGRSRYISNSFWASLNNEVEDLPAILIEPSDDREDADSSSSSEEIGQQQRYIFSLSSTSVDMRSLHPTPEIARQLWEVYKDRVEPLVKVLHIPTFEQTFDDALAHPEKVGKGLESLLFAIYFGAVTSTSTDKCLQNWSENRSSLSRRYRFALEQALARANFLYGDEIVIPQALVIYLLLLRRSDDAKKIWTLTGLVVRIAQTLGLHRDASHFGLATFETEMRRRLWWQIYILDARSSEDHGCDPAIIEAQFDAQMPLNVNDSDLHPGMIDFPNERTGFTDMTFSLIRFELAKIYRRILCIPPESVRCAEPCSGASIAEKEKWITECQQQVEDKYLKDCDMSIPLCRVTATISRLIISKMWLIMYHPCQRKDGGASLAQETKDKLFDTSLESVEYSILLETEAQTMNWGWLCRTYVQWHAIAFLLSELCVRTKGEAVSRAWRALEATVDRWWVPLNDTSPYRKGQQGYLWKPLRKLLAKARAAREREVILEQAFHPVGSWKHLNIVFPCIKPNTLPPVTTDQPNSVSLDTLFRPFASTLGETSISASPTRRTECSESLYTSRPITGVVGEGFGQSQWAQSRMYPDFRSIGHQFQHLTKFGLDNVILDVMDGQGYAPLNTLSPAQEQSHLTQATQSNYVTSSQPATNGATPMDGVYIADHPSISNVDFRDLTTTGATSGQSNDSSILDGNIDWQFWDDMVNQYGHEGRTVNNPDMTGTRHLDQIHFL